MGHARPHTRISRPARSCCFPLERGKQRAARVSGIVLSTQISERQKNTLFQLLAQRLPRERLLRPPACGVCDRTIACPITIQSEFGRTNRLSRRSQKTHYFANPTEHVN